MSNKVKGTDVFAAHIEKFILKIVVFKLVAFYLSNDG